MPAHACGGKGPLTSFDFDGMAREWAKSVGYVEEDARPADEAGLASLATLLRRLAEAAQAQGHRAGYALGREEEREACARACEDMAAGNLHESRAIGALLCAGSIRRREAKS